MCCLLNGILGYLEVVKGGDIQPSRHSTQMKLAEVWERTPANIHLPGFRAAKESVMVMLNDNMNGD